MSRTVKYDAFISYRHCKPDSEIASKLHKKLESYKLPREVAKKVGKKSLNRVFRDEAELAVSDDLSESIEKAISNSKYLIAICSPEYLNSAWCMKEIEAFLKHSDRKHILLVLADGEPVTSFPEILRYDEFVEFDDDGKEITVKRPVEPLAADCRGEDSKERNSKIETAVLRLTASMIGVGYDDLNQRHRKEQNRKRTRRTLIAFGILGLFIAVCLFFLVKISKQNAIISQRYSDTLAATSVNLLRDGKRKDAVYVARMALSGKKEEDFSESATQALVDALGIYSSPDTLSCASDIMLPCSLSSFSVSPSGKYMSVLGLDNIRYVINSETGEIIFFYDDYGYGDVCFDGDRGLVFQREDENISYFDFANLSETDLGIDEGRFYPDDKGHGYAITTYDGVYLYKGCNEEGRLVFETDAPYISERFDVHTYYNEDGSRVLIYIWDYDNSMTFAYTYEFDNAYLCRVILNNDEIVFDTYSDGEYIYWTESPFGEHSTICRQRIDNASETYRESLNDDVYGIIAYSGMVVVYGQNNLILMDNNLIELGRIKVDSYLTGTISNGDIYVIEESKSGIHRFHEGEYSFYEIEEQNGQILSMKEYSNNVLFTGGVGENHISTYTFQDSEYIDTYNDDCDEIRYYDYDDPYKQEFKYLVLNKDNSITEDRIYDVTLCENAELGIIQLWDGQVRIYDSKKGELIKIIYAMDGLVNSFFYDQNNDFYYVSADNLEVYDKQFRNIYRIEKCNLLGIDPASHNPVIQTWRDGKSYCYVFTPLKYNRLLELADEFLGDFVPDERVREKYSLELE